VRRFNLGGQGAAVKARASGRAKNVYQFNDTPVPSRGGH
jgi:hypothetical protein